MGGLTAEEKAVGRGRKRKSAGVEEGVSTQPTVESEGTNKRKGRKPKKVKYTIISSSEPT